MTKTLDRVVGIMERAHGRDISVYDEVFLQKTLEKRLVATGIGNPSAYGEYLLVNGSEAEALSCSLSISYSEFFRNQLTCALLEQLILPGILATKEKKGRGEIRVWSAGCASGQEAYSVAILLDELVADRGKHAVTFRIFATDRSEHELESARQGVYDFAAVRNVRHKHLQKYFTARGDAFQVVDRLKKQVDFSVHDMLDERLSCPSESIYGDFDLVFCGNLLFYYRPEVRHFILNKICHCLTPGGYLVTGEAEKEIVTRHECFRGIVPPSAIFQKNVPRGTT
ncbi:MAG: protein-glutamate O-methyltransferase CheR [Desulfuromonadales bacterium]|nr:protein-glutamate O-methyltransferase CheR [Desulfuromonadales bacterium]